MKYNVQLTKDITITIKSPFFLQWDNRTQVGLKFLNYTDALTL